MNSTLHKVLKFFRTKASNKHVSEIPNVGRNDLPRLFKYLDCKIGVEIGTAEGEFAEIICKANPQLKLYTIDPFEPYEDFRELPYTPVFPRFEKTARERLSKYNCVVVKDYSMNAVKNFKDNSIDFVYIDGNHAFPFVVNDIFEWSKKVKVGGIISGDDYVRTKRQLENTHHVIQAVDGYVRAYKIRPWFLLGLTAKIPGLKRDTSRSWFWVKEEDKPNLRT